MKTPDFAHETGVKNRSGFCSTSFKSLLGIKKWRLEYENHENKNTLMTKMRVAGDIECLAALKLDSVFSNFFIASTYWSSIRTCKPT